MRLSEPLARKQLNAPQVRQRLSVPLALRLRHPPTRWRRYCGRGSVCRLRLRRTLELGRNAMHCALRCWCLGGALLLGIVCAAAWALPLRTGCYGHGLNSLRRVSGTAFS